MQKPAPAESPGSRLALLFSRPLRPPPNGAIGFTFPDPSRPAPIGDQERAGVQSFPHPPVLIARGFGGSLKKIVAG